MKKILTLIIFIFIVGGLFSIFNVNLSLISALGGDAEVGGGFGIVVIAGEVDNSTNQTQPNNDSNNNSSNNSQDNSNSNSNSNSNKGGNSGSNKSSGYNINQDTNNKQTNNNARNTGSINTGSMNLNSNYTIFGLKSLTMSKNLIIVLLLINSILLFVLLILFIIIINKMENV